MRDAAIIAGRLHPVMGAQRVIAPGQVLARIRVEVAERRRQAVAAVLARRAAERPQRVLQPLGQGHVAFAAEDDVRMLEARIDQPEMIEPMIEPFTGDGDAEVGHVGKIRQPHPAGFMDLAEDHLLVGTVQSAPGTDAPLQGTPDARGQSGVATLHLFEDGNRPQLRGGLQHRYDLGVEEIGQRVRAAAATDLRIVRR